MTKWPDKFDIVVANPPYSNFLHIKFLDKAFDLAGEDILFVHPATSFINLNGKSKDLIHINEKIKKNIKELVFFNGNIPFDTGLFLPYSITHLDMTKDSENFTLDNRISGMKYEMDRIKPIPIQGKVDLDEYSALYDKIKEISKGKSLKSEANMTGTKKIGQMSGEKDYGVQFTHIRGHATNEKDYRVQFSFIQGCQVRRRDYKVQFSYIRGNSINNGFMTMDAKLYKPDFYTLFKKSTRVEKNPKIRYNIWFEFYTEEEGNNFIKYGKTDFARFCLSISKYNQHLYGDQLKMVPIVDFTQEWTDEKLYKHFGITQKEQEIIKAIIPPYYD